MNTTNATEIERIDGLIDEGKGERVTLVHDSNMPAVLTLHKVPRRAGRKPHYKVGLLAGTEGQDLEIYVSPTGSSVRVFRNGVELT